MSSLCPWYMTPIDRPTYCLILSTTCEAVGDISSCKLPHVPYDPDVKMQISEIYPAISGEGSSTGMVCVIVRTVGCNARCRFCDSKYSYEGGTTLPLKDVVAAVLKFGIKTVLFTGGEPLLDKNAAHAFLLAMIHHGIKVFVETNGSIDILPFKLLSSIVMDIKCPSSGMADRLFVDNLQNIGPFDEVKFVVGDRIDYEYAKEITEKHELFKKTSNVYISPVWTDGTEFFQQLSNWLIEDRSTMKLMIQQHKVIWGSVKRGV